MRPTTVAGAPLRIPLVLDVPLADVLPDSGASMPGESLRWVYGDDAGDRWLDEGTGLDYPTMVRAAHRALGEAGALDDVRVVVLAVAVPDLQHERLLGGFVAHLFGDVPFAFAVTDQGSAGPFTALRLAHEQLLGTGGRAVVVALEQCTLPTDGSRRPGRDRVVVVVADHGPLGRTVGDLVVRRVPATHPGAGSLVVLLDADGRPHPDGSHLADPEAYSTGVWEVLARLTGDAAVDQRALLVADEDLDLRYRSELRLGPVTDAPTGTPTLETVGAA
ncbi:hypothetical protein [Oerskovia rustica]|uniref:Uncharacterized protein n=1 Tax=Oerskovia rustica TaxID=2762237 RepID=A0ABR8RWD5_9CELL|nr:hypothetical protein [Oerskovia rustica]MBD7952114.1 hypothetical protein [Oerskovia rustica]